MENKTEIKLNNDAELEAPESPVSGRTDEEKVNTNINIEVLNKQIEENLEKPVEQDKENIEQNEAELISNKNEYEFNAPLHKQDSNNSNSDESDHSESERENSSPSGNTNKKVAFSENYHNNEEYVPLLEGINPVDNFNDKSGFSQSSKKFNDRFVLSRVNEENEIDKKTYDLIQKPNIKYFLDENGSIINDKNQKGALSAQPESNDNLSSSGIRYNKETKSIESNRDSQKKGSKTLLTSKSFYQALFAELIGTYLLVLYICSFGLPIGSPNDSVASINGALGTGVVVSSLVWGLGHVSGANLNPAVSLALLITGEINIVKVLFYIPCQLLGSILAALTLKSLVPLHVLKPDNLNTRDSAVLSNSSNAAEKSLIQDFNPSVGVTLLNDKITPMQGLTVEAIITFILIFTIFACIDNKRKDLGGSFPLSIGLALVVGALFGGKFTGASMNPARSFGPALVYSNWKNHYIYWIGPISGAIIGALIYKLLVLKTKKTPKRLS